MSISGRHKSLVTCLGSVLLLGFLIIATHRSAQWFIPQHAIRQDFVEYWASGRLFLSGENPYAESAVATLQQNLGRQTPLYMWNGPWLLTASLPLYCFDFPTAAGVWFGLNLLWVGISLLLLRQLIAKPSLQAFTAIEQLCLLLSFYPIWNSIALGQLGTLLLLGITLVLSGLKFQRPGHCAIGLIILSLKPHLVLLLAPLLLVGVLHNRPRQILSYTFGIGAVLLLATSLISPPSLSGWISQISKPPLQYVGATAIGFLRAQLDGTVTIPTLALMNLVIPLLMVVAITGWTLAKRHQRHVISTTDLLIWLPLAVLFSPYGWVFDFALLLPSYFFAAAQLENANGARKYAGAILLLGSQAAIPLGISWGYTEHHQYFWVPLVIWLVCVSSSQNKATSTLAI